MADRIPATSLYTARAERNISQPTIGRALSPQPSVIHARPSVAMPRLGASGMPDFRRRLPRAKHRCFQSKGWSRCAFTSAKFHRRMIYSLVSQRHAVQEITHAVQVVRGDLYEPPPTGSVASPIQGCRFA
jgi:hypothetical protein